MKTISISVIGGLGGLLVGLTILNRVDYPYLPVFILLGIVIGLIASRWPMFGMSLMGGMAGWTLGDCLAHHRDGIMPVTPMCGFAIGLIAGPAILAVVRLIVKMFGIK